MSRKLVPSIRKQKIWFSEPQNEETSIKKTQMCCKHSHVSAELWGGCPSVIQSGKEISPCIITWSTVYIVLLFQKMSWNFRCRVGIKTQRASSLPVNLFRGRFGHLNGSASKKNINTGIWPAELEKSLVKLCQTLLYCFHQYCYEFWNSWWIIHNYQIHHHSSMNLGRLSLTGWWD